MSLKTNLYVDLGIFAAFLVAFEPRLTGITIHEWFSLAMAAALIVHLLLHWNWVVTVTLQFFQRLFHSSRLNYVLDLLLLITFVTIMLSGLMISRSVMASLGITVPGQPAWRFLHSASADFSLVLVGLHVALRWKWIASTFKRYVLDPFRPRPATRLGQPAAVPVEKRSA